MSIDVKKESGTTQRRPLSETLQPLGIGTPDEPTIQEMIDMGIPIDVPEESDKDLTTSQLHDKYRDGSFAVFSQAMRQRDGSWKVSKGWPIRLGS